MMNVAMMDLKFWITLLPTLITNIVTSEEIFTYAPETSYLKNTTLYFGSQGWTSGNTRYPAGIYGGMFNAKNDQSSNFTEVNKHCFITENMIRERNFKTRVISHDKITDRLLVQMSDPHKISLFTMKRCTYSDICSFEKIYDSEKAKTIFSHSVTTDRALKCETSLQAFVMNNGVIYYLVKRIIKNRRTYLFQLELRELTGCESYDFHSQYPFNMNKCSLLISIIDSQPTNRCHFINSAHVIFTFNSYEIEGIKQKHFLIQVFNRTHSDFKVNLFSVFEAVPPKLVYSHSLPYNLHKYTDHGHHLGGIDYKDGRLCWSVVNSILCGQWDGLQLTNVENILPEGVAASSSCYVGSSGDLELKNITTGVILSDYSIETGYTILFGCQQENEKWGGAGVVKLYPYTYSPSFYPILHLENSRIHAGLMFMAETCDTNCSVKNQRTILILLITMVAKISLTL